MKQAKIKLEAEFNEEYGRTVFYDRKTGKILFVATETIAEWLQDPFELAEMIVYALVDMTFNPVLEEAEDETDADSIN